MPPGPNDWLGQTAWFADDMSHPVFHRPPASPPFEGRVTDADPRVGRPGSTGVQATPYAQSPRYKHPDDVPLSQDAINALHRIALDMRQDQIMQEQLRLGQPADYARMIAQNEVWREQQGQLLSRDTGRAMATAPSEWEKRANVPAGTWRRGVYRELLLGMMKARKEGESVPTNEESDPRFGGE